MTTVPPRVAPSEGADNRGAAGSRWGARRPSARERVDRLGGDVALLMLLQSEGFAGPAWERFIDEAGAYGFQVLRGWIYTGQITVELARKKVRGIGELELRRLRWDRETAEELAARPQRWDWSSSARKSWRPEAGTRRAARA